VTIILKPEQEKLLQDVISSGLAHTARGSALTRLSVARIFCSLGP
jgi:hypothetical protein